jgi:tetratricopeptide (TPR) repeat protein
MERLSCGEAQAMGHHEEAIAHGKRAKELDLLTPYVRSDLGWSYNLARRYDDAIAECAQIPEIDPKFYFTYWCLGFAYWQKGMLEQAVGAYERAINLEPEDLHLKAEAAMAYVAAGKPAEAQAILKQLEEKSRREYVIPVALAMTYLAVGDLDGTFEWLDRMYEERSPVLIWLNVQPRYDALRGDPRFQELLRRIGFRELKFIPATAFK